METNKETVVNLYAIIIEIKPNLLLFNYLHYFHYDTALCLHARYSQFLKNFHGKNRKIIFDCTEKSFWSHS